jgi:hypothetical protein
MYVFCPQILSETFPILTTIKRDIIIKVLRASSNLEFSGQVFEKKKSIQILNFVKICPVGAELFHADGRTDITKPIVAFRNFANTSKNTEASLLPASTQRT